jgi:hypothetical protein
MDLSSFKSNVLKMMSRPFSPPHTTFSSANEYTFPRSSVNVMSLIEHQKLVKRITSLSQNPFEKESKTLPLSAYSNIQYSHFIV